MSRTPAPPRLPRVLNAPRAWTLALLIASSALIAAGPAQAKKGKIARGTEMRLSGLVTATDGTPVKDVRVLLESSRWDFRPFKLRRERLDTRWLATDSNARGEYTLRWPWDGDHNRFFLVVAVPTRNASGDYMHELFREEVTERIKLGSPAVVPVVVRDLSFLRSFREFLADLDSDDEQKIYQREGRPDKVESVPGAEGQETTWWYFQAGKLYRFQDGNLLETEPFDPVRDF